MKRPRQALLIAILLLLGLAPARAASKRVGVPSFSGPQEALVRKKVMAVLKAHGYELVRSRDMQAAAASTGASLDSDDGLKTVAKELALVAIVTGEVTAKRATLTVHDGSDGSTLGDAKFGGANPRKVAAEVGTAFWRKLGGELARAKLPSGAKKNQKASEPEAGEDTEEAGEGAAGAAGEPAESKPAPEAEAAPPPEVDAPKSKKKVKMEGEASSEPSTPSGLSWLDISLGVSVLNRDLSFHQDASPQGSQMSPYSLPAWPVGMVTGVLYLEPLVAALGNLGVEGQAMQGFGISSKFSTSSTAFSSTVHDYSGGARYRFPFGPANAVFVSARYGEDAFTFSGSGRNLLLTPDTIYHYARGGLGVQLALSPSFSLSAGGGYRYVTNKAGPQISQQFFPHLGVAGADAQVALTYAFSDIYALRGGVDWRRYWFDFHSVKGDNYIVGGAVDQSFLFNVSLVLTIGGSSGEHAAAEPAPAKKADKSDKSDKSDKADKSDNAKGDEGGSDEGGGSGSGAKPSGGDDI